MGIKNPDFFFFFFFFFFHFVVNNYDLLFAHGP
jgi:hypothetical protein